MVLRVTNTLTGRLTAVRRRPGRPLGMYVCGPTVYAPPHVGHARTYLYFDVVRRTLEADGVPVRHVMNITDFEEKIDRRAAALGLSWRQLARREERTFYRDMGALGIRHPTVCPRASEFIPRMVKVAALLERTGRVQRLGDAWYYHPPERSREENFPVTAELAEHAVPEPGHPFPTSAASAGEFMVWQRQEPPLPSWIGPWGPGMPGWHLECFSMASRYLGIPVDLHGGGLDLIYPHHHAENEIAYALTGHPFSRAFLHTAFVLQNGRKMSKSTQNLTLIQDALELADAGALRWYLLRPRYTERLEWNPAELSAAGEEYHRARSAIAGWLRAPGGGRWGSTAAGRLARDVRSDLGGDLATDRAIRRISQFGRALEADHGGGIPRGERPAVTRSVAAIEERLGLVLR